MRVSDQADRAQDFIDRAYLTWEQRQQPATRESAYRCHECGCRIPDPRREAIPGVTHCVSCVETGERRQRLYAPGARR